MPILQYPRYSLSDQTNSHGLVRCRSDRDRGSPAFVKFDDVRIKPGTILDIFPGEQFVIARGKGFEAEFAGLAGTRSFEKVSDGEILLRRCHHAIHKACIFPSLQHLLRGEAVPLQLLRCAGIGRARSCRRARDGSHKSPPRRQPDLLWPATRCPSSSTIRFEYPPAGSQEL